MGSLMGMCFRIMGSDRNIAQIRVWNQIEVRDQVEVGAQEGVNCQVCV
jgi:hypothetical protein